MPGRIGFNSRWVRLAIAFATTSVVAVGIILSGLSLYRPASSYAVSMNGKLIGYVQSSTAYQELIQGVINEARADWGCDLVLNEKIEASLVSRWYPANDGSLLHARMKDTATYTTRGYAIVVNGQPIVIIDSFENATALLDAVKAKYTPANRNIKSVTFIDSITIQETSADPVDVSDWDTALQTLIQGGDNTTTYVVRRGDTLGGIARSYSTTVEELRKANSLKNDMLQVGQVLNLQDNSGQIRVRTVHELAVTEVINYAVEYRSNPDITVKEDRVINSGSTGSREVTWQIEMVNGQEVRRTALASKVVKSPTTRVIMTGSGYWPSRPTTFLRFPMNTGKIYATGLFGASRGSRLHMGLDVVAPSGTPIYAAADGIIRTRSYDGSATGYGYYVVIEHKDGYATLYAHCSSIPSWVQPGRKVVRGQVVAYVGNTGYSFGAHLHWEVRINGQRVNPLGFFR